MKKTFLILVILFFGTSCYAQQFSYQPKNPAFGGDTFNYSWLLSSANSQNSHAADKNERDEESDLDRFGENINKQLLSQISRTLLEEQLGDFDFTKEGTFTYGSLNIEITETGEGLIINILDTSNGEQSQIIVPN